MRLTPHQIEAIKQSATEVFGAEAQVWLFGSRVDDSKRGGDIDLYVEVPSIDPDEIRRLESRFWIRLQRRLGERRIDIVTHLHGTPLRPIDQQARDTGVRL
ncbi:MAG: nucleotidyltransferase domain-containing protein [Wenzhouxiangella sp.]|nr:nucleotidyltransferase domain-containing protein [Wenzhouxiangella sp.]MCH8479740.1 nucleotidyltransferase domain-containing protein [Wenzhouxiangella sp.]